MMKTKGLIALLAVCALKGPAAKASPAHPVFELIGTYTTGLADPGSELTSAEVAVLKGDKLFVSNASDRSVDIVDVSDPATPILLKRIDLSAYGTEVTSVAVGNGLVAATVEAGTEPGNLVVFSPGGPICARFKSARVRTW